MRYDFSYQFIDIEIITRFQSSVRKGHERLSSWKKRFQIIRSHIVLLQLHSVHLDSCVVKPCI